MDANMYGQPQNIMPMFLRTLYRVCDFFTASFVLLSPIKSPEKLQLTLTVRFVSVMQKILMTDVF